VALKSDPRPPFSRFGREMRMQIHWQTAALPADPAEVAFLLLRRLDRKISGIRD